MSLIITHLSSAHPRYDTRIFFKECCSLAKVKEYKVSLIIADGLGDELKKDVQIYDVGLLVGRRNRMFKTTKAVLLKAIELNSDLYHFHDPELIPVGLKLKKMGKKVIFDIHEDVPKQILAKPYLNPLAKKALSYAYSVYEDYTCRKFDYLVTPTSIINKRFKALNPKSRAVKNYPLCEEFENTNNWKNKEKCICHIGSLAKARGIKELVKSLEVSKVRLELGGDFRPNLFEDEVKELKGWKYVDYRGYLTRLQVQEMLRKSKIGMVTLHPTKSYLEALPVKMFEYMASGIPVIASDFLVYKDLLEGYDCALFVDPTNSNEIAQATLSLLKDDALMQKMGAEGKRAVNEKFNWLREEEILFQIYNELLT